MASNKKYWKSEAELNPNDSIVETLKENEFVSHIPVDEFLGDKESLADSSTTRRDFLKYVGFSTAAATVAACEGPVHKSVPYEIQPENIVLLAVNGNDDRDYRRHGADPCNAGEGE